MIGAALPASAPEIKRLRSLHGGAGGASVEVVEISGELFVLKRSSPAKSAGEQRFQQALQSAGLPHLRVAHHPALRPDELLLEYVEGSPTIGGSPTPELCRRWGEAVAGLHSVRVDRFQQVDDAGRIVDASWAGFADRLVSRAIGAQRGRDTDLSASLIAEAEARLERLRDLAPSRFVFTHGDLHANNALVRGADIVLFDKASQVWSCPAAFDLALVYSEGFPGARYGVSRPGDEARMNAFVTGYGALPAEDERWLDHFALAHGLIRYPTPFVPDLREVIEAALERLPT